MTAELVALAELALFFPRTDPRFSTAKGRAEMAQAIADDPDWSVELHWENLARDDARPDYWDVDDPETW